MQNTPLTSTSASLNNSKAAELYALAQKAGMVLPEPGINPAQAFMDGAFAQGEPAAHEVTSCVWGLETGLLASAPSEIYAAGVWAINFWKAGQADDRLRPFVLAHALATYVATLEAPAEYFDPWAGLEVAPASSMEQGAQLGELVPNTVEDELADLVAEKAAAIEAYLARALGRGLSVDSNDLHDAANPQSGAVDAGGEYGDAVAIAAIKLAAARLLADQEPFIAALNRIKADKVAEAERAKAPDPWLAWL